MLTLANGAALVAALSLSQEQDEETMTKIIVTRETFARGKALKPGKKPIEVDKNVARDLIAAGKAIKFDPKAEKEAAAEAKKAEAEASKAAAEEKAEG